MNHLNELLTDSHIPCFVPKLICVSEEIGQVNDSVTSVSFLNELLSLKESD